jgi:hypothetical protein
MIFMQKKQSYLPVAAFLLCIISFYSCKKYNYTEFTESDKEWMIYSEGQQLKFKNQNGIIRNYQVFNLQRGYFKSGNNYDSYTFNYFKWDGDTLTLNGKFQVDKKGGGTNITFSWPRFTGEASLHLLPQSADSVGGAYYTDLIQIISSSTTAINNIDSAWYSKSKGPVRFTDTNGNNWIREN